DYPGLIYVMEPMDPATEYYVRAFAMTTDNQVGYGQVRRIITLPMGKCTWHYAYNGEEADNKRLAAAAEGAMYYYNHWTNIQDYGINVNFDPGDASAHCSYGGWMTVGPNAGYQKIGTVMHESGHGVGQGQIWQWSWTQLKGDTPWVPENLGDKDGGPTGGEIVNTEPAEGVWWQGERSNMMVYFLTDGQDLANGDWGHCGPFGVNGAGADNGTRILYIANALEVHGMGEDGMPPSGGSASPYYAFHSMDTTLYYISNEEVAYGGGTQYLTETSTGTLKYVKATADQAIADSAYAWNILFQPETCYYLFRNAKSGKYFTFKSGTIKSAVVAQPGATESFHLMPSRYYARYGTKSNPIKHKGYWIVEGDRSQWAAPTMEAASNGRVNTTGQIFENNQVNQRWLLLTAQEAKALSDELGAINKSKLERYIEGARGILAAQHTETTEGVTESLAAVVDRVAPTLPSLTSVEQINADLADATAAITNYLVGTTPADMLPYDITFMLDNAEMDAIDGWTNDGDEVTITKGVAEVKDGKFDLYQTLPKMPKGVYRLTVNAFERPGTVATAAREFAAGTNNATTQIYLRTTANKTPVKHLMEEAQEEALGVGTERSCTQGYVPNNTTAATEYFNQGFYNNELVMRMSVKADLKVGIQNTKAITNDWIAFDNFRLYYYGDEVTTEDVTGISGVTTETTDNSRTYDLTGRTVTHPVRGLYIRNGKTYIKK
ncbi:MAG: hypothetical protein HUK02_09825, partial [Bacteroidaceae bacterium]|nr:hypothetical protein [Bacteroidaceae bacterium]